MSRFPLGRRRLNSCGSSESGFPSEPTHHCRPSLRHPRDRTQGLPVTLGAGPCTAQQGECESPTMIESMFSGISPEAIAMTVALYLVSSKRRLIANN